jgi:hypothetical protein
MILCILAYLNYSQYERNQLFKTGGFLSTTGCPKCNRLQEAVTVIVTLMPRVKGVSGWVVGYRLPKGPISYKIHMGEPAGQHLGGGGGE